MKFRCGKCGKTNEAPEKLNSNQIDRTLKVVCAFCQSTNKVPNLNYTNISQPNAEDFDPTVIVSKKKLQMPGNNILIETAGLTPGWIFVHDESTPMQSFDLKPGMNIIGRKSSTSTDIAIETRDEYMSRKHCLIEVVMNKQGLYEFRLSDFKALNGTFINGISKKKLGSEDIIILNDGDTIQIGMTKVVIRINKKTLSKDQVQEEVKVSSYHTTVIVQKRQ